jgi:hypothetical protein
VHIGEASVLVVPRLRTVNVHFNFKRFVQLLLQHSYSLFKMCTFVAYIEKTLNQTLVFVCEHLNLEDKFSLQVDLFLE